MARSIVKNITGKKKSVLKDIEKFEQLDHNDFNLDYADIPEQEDPFDDLAQAIIKGYEVSNAPKHQTKKSFSPSTLVFGHGVCPRYWYLAFEGNTFHSNNTGKAIANMDSGTDRHERVQAAMEGAGVLSAAEVWAENDDPPVRGKVDCFINWKDEEYVGEIKTKDDEGFKYYVKTRKPSSYHVLQLLFYMKIYKKKNGLIIYENKNTHDILILPITITQKHVDFINYMFDWMREVWAAWQNKTLPEIPFRGGKQIKLCDSCPLQKACSEAPSGSVKIARRKDEKGEF